VKLPGLLSLAIAAGILAQVPQARCATYSPLEFNRELKERIGNKKGSAAYNTASAFLLEVLKDRSNKKNADKYMKSTVKILKSSRVVPLPLQVESCATLLAATTKGYLKELRPNPADKTLNKALVTLLKSLPLSHRHSMETMDKLYQLFRRFFPTLPPVIPKGSPFDPLPDYPPDQSVS
jgi:hypothetical protein